MRDVTTQHLPEVETVQQLVRQGANEIVLTPDTPVLCIHRGRRLTEGGEPVYHLQAARHRDNSREPYFVGDYKDTYDGQHYVVAPGYFMAPYGAALHFKRRAVVPGSRNPETNFEASFIAIIGVVQPHAGGGFTVLKAVDDQSDWTPFSDEECAAYEVQFEALDRSNMQLPIDKDVTLKSVAGNRGGRSNSRRPQIETSSAEVLEPIEPGANAAIREAAEGTAARGAGQGSADNGADPVGDGTAVDPDPAPAAPSPQTAARTSRPRSGGRNRAH